MDFNKYIKSTVGTIILLLSFIFFNQNVTAQTGIGTPTPDASAKLDVYSTNKGFLPPRVTLTSATVALPITSPAEGLLVYNIGSVGLQAGYYYWNGTSWATIATASSAGNGLSSSDLVKLYGEAFSEATGKIGNVTSGFVFTVPISGRYLFDFSMTGYSNASITFKVRQGSTVLAVDSQYSYNNTVHVEYNGKVEVNLQSGVSYNVHVKSNGNRDLGDFDRVYYKLVAGNLPVTGQSVEYGIARYTGSDGGSLTAGALVGFDATAAGNLTWSGNKFTLKANKTYELESYLAIYQSVGWVAGIFQIYDYTNNTVLANGLYMSMKGEGTYNPNANGLMRAIITPTSDMQVGIKFISFSGAAYAPGLIGSANTVTGAAPNQCYFLAKQIGSSAIVNPWTLSGTNTYNTTGNVGIGTSSPAAKLDVTGNVNVTGKINLTDPSGNVVVKAAGFVNAGDYVTLGNLKARIPTSGNRSLQLATGSGTYSIYGSGVHVFASNLGSTTIDGSSPRAISTTPAYLNSGNTFGTAGGTDTWNIMDTSNLIGWRITAIISSGYNANFISIERLL